PHMPGGQVIVPSPELTVPDWPERPMLMTVTLTVLTVKVAVTLLAESMVTTQAPFPLHPAPIQLVKVEYASGAAERLTCWKAAGVVRGYWPTQLPLAEHWSPVAATVPPPVPILVTVRVTVSRPTPDRAAVALPPVIALAVTLALRAP